MPDRQIIHADFTIERDFLAPAAAVYAAFSDAEQKQAWFAPRSEMVRPREVDQPGEAGQPDHSMAKHELDFRIGGREFRRGRTGDGPVVSLTATYYDIVPNERIVYAYETYHNETRVSVSLATIEFLPEDDGTLLILTESGVFLDGFDKPKWRKEATNRLLDALEDLLERAGNR
jgi:uncharacterized protein YndB with AHSA1/START domain